MSSHVQWNEIVEVRGYDEDLSILNFDSDPDENNEPSPSKATEKVEIPENHPQTPAPSPSATTPSPAPQKARSRPPKLESSESSGNSSDSETSSERPQRATAEYVDYRALNDPWAKPKGFAVRANRVHIESDCPQTIEQARASPDWKFWEPAFLNEMEAHQKNNTYTLAEPPSDRMVLPTR